MIKSPLTKTNNISLIKIIKVDELIASWKNNFQIDISKEYQNQILLYLYQCQETKLKFFIPLKLSGSSDLYSKLEKFDWYYMPRKWEHDVALQDLKECKKVIEVGCGKGAFVKRLLEEKKLDAQGIELNKSAVQYALANNIPVFAVNLEKFAEEESNNYDAVCSFQVLEHVSDPLDFLQSLVKLLKPKGKLIISVPNDASFIKYDDYSVLNKPPHHMTLWCTETFKGLTNILPIKIVHFKYEPLADYHVDWYINVQKYRFTGNKFLNLPIKVISKILRPIYKRNSLIRNFIKGHTLYVCFEKI